MSGLPRKVEDAGHNFWTYPPNNDDMCTKLEARSKPFPLTVIGKKTPAFFLASQIAISNLPM
ncbi:hypothetical protein DSO57_1017627 [Entomophthora muscae]|uniref:Uncharacterized protein n=1 Tax=Entomophthora muscae TaxID=34485 RepID=A0ACC2RVS7_9FUNG|nr:hypothetical protein DSO57_1017627 [Entomophthora muscae]